MHLFQILKFWYHNPCMCANHCSKGCSLFTLVHLEMICSSQGDLAFSELSSFYHTSLRERKTGFESYQKECGSLDDFYVKEANICNCKILSSVFKFVLMLSHGQSTVERGLIVKNKVLNVNTPKLSITSRKFIIDHMNSHNLATVIHNHKESVEISEILSTKI